MPGVGLSVHIVFFFFFNKHVVLTQNQHPTAVSQWSAVRVTDSVVPARPRGAGSQTSTPPPQKSQHLSCSCLISWFLRNEAETVTVNHFPGML
eukprot:2498274-Prymnesium_polylepis.1